MTLVYRLPYFSLKSSTADSVLYLEPPWINWAVADECRCMLPFDLILFFERFDLVLNVACIIVYDLIKHMEPKIRKFVKNK